MAEPPPTRKVPVSVHELVRRIRDALPEWQQFKFTRNDPLARRLFGDYYIIDLRTHVPILGRTLSNSVAIWACLNRGRRSNHKRKSDAPAIAVLPRSLCALKADLARVHLNLLRLLLCFRRFWQRHRQDFILETRLNLIGLDIIRYLKAALE